VKTITSHFIPYSHSSNKKVSIHKFIYSHPSPLYKSTVQSLKIISAIINAQFPILSFL